VVLVRESSSQLIRYLLDTSVRCSRSTYLSIFKSQKGSIEDRYASVNSDWKWPLKKRPHIKVRSKYSFLTINCNYLLYAIGKKSYTPRSKKKRG
jgi:hypothetical protein